MFATKDLVVPQLGFCLSLSSRLFEAIADEELKKMEIPKLKRKQSKHYNNEKLEDFERLMNRDKSKDIIQSNFFKQNKLLDPFKETILKNISKNNTLKKISKFISNQGLSI